MTKQRYVHQGEVLTSPQNIRVAVSLDPDVLFRFNVALERARRSMVGMAVALRQYSDECNVIDQRTRGE